MPIGGVVLGWSAVKYAVKKLPETVEGIRQSVDDLRRDETGSVRGGGSDQARYGVRVLKCGCIEHAGNTH
jgi:hypothetical protein